MMSYFQRLVGVSLYLLFILNTLGYAQSEYQKIVIFGDSLSDCGFIHNDNLNNLVFVENELDLAGNNYWIDTGYGKQGTPITSSLDKAGAIRPLWINYLSSQLSVEAVYPMRIAKANGSIDKTHVINYAFASALTGDNYISDKVSDPLFMLPNPNCNAPGIYEEDGTTCVPGLVKQVNLYLDDNSNNANALKREVLFIIWAGGNDLFNGLVQGLNPMQMIELATANVKLAVDILLKKGIKADQILLIDLPDISQTPAAKKMAHNFAGEDNQAYLSLLQNMRYLSEHFNRQLAYQLPESNYSGMKRFSAFTLLDQLANDPDQYGLNTNGDCVTSGQLNACNGYIFYDDKHPTTAVHQILAQALAKVIQVGNAQRL